MSETSMFLSKPRAVITFLTLAGSLVPVVALADGPPAPPAAAYDACDSKAAGEACTVTFHEHTIDGTCNQRGSDTRLSCRPNHRPIPQAAFTACEGKAAAAPCTMTFHEHTVDGSCETAPDSTVLACRPSQPPSARESE